MGYHLFKIVLFSIAFNLFLGDALMADLNHPLYKSAKKEYENKNWSKVLFYLNDYKIIDRNYLDNNPDIKISIDSVIIFCQNNLTIFIGHGYFAGQHKMSALERNVPPLPK